MHPDPADHPCGASSAVDASAFYQLEELRRVRDHTFGRSMRWCARCRAYTIARSRRSDRAQQRLGTTKLRQPARLWRWGAARMHAEHTVRHTLLDQAGNDAALARSAACSTTTVCRLRNRELSRRHSDAGLPSTARWVAVVGAISPACRNGELTRPAPTGCRSGARAGG